MSNDFLASSLIVSFITVALSYLAADWMKSQDNNNARARNVLRILALIICAISFAVGTLTAAFLISEMFFFTLLLATFIIMPIVALSRPAVWLMEQLVRIGGEIGGGINWNCFSQQIRTLSISDIYIFASGIVFMLSMLYNQIYFGALGIKAAPSSYISIDWLPYIALYAIISLIIIALGAWRIKNAPPMGPTRIVTATAVLLFPFLCIAHHCFINSQTFYSHLKWDDMDRVIIAMGLSILIYCALASSLIDTLRGEAFLANNFLAWFKFLCSGQAVFIISIIFGLFTLVPKYAIISTDCYKQVQHSFTLADGDEINGVLARNFDTHLLIRNCDSNKLEFVKADRFTGPNWK